MSYKTILVTDSHPIRTVTLNRPERRNAMTREMQTELIGVMEETAATQCCALDTDWGRRRVLLGA